jgi:hypothetical protein
MANKRMYYAVYALGIAKDGFNTYTLVHGLQSLGLTTRFNLDHIFEISQLNEYQAVENLPDVEATCEKAIDGYPALWHLATQGATSPTLAGRSNIKCTLGVSYYTDTQENASGTPLKQCVISGTFPSQLSYNFPTEGVCTESVTFIGNNKAWLSSSFTFTPNQVGTDAPPTGVQRRQNVLFGSGTNYSKLPSEIPGISSDNYNIQGSDGYFPTHVRNIRIQTNLGRTPLYELGRRGPYHRTIDFPTEVRTDIEIYCGNGDLISADENSEANLTDQTIHIKLTSGERFDLGTKNKLQNVSETGGNAGTGGGNRTITYSYVNFNSMNYNSANDPSGL